jgi:methylated-DNA-[protein]-cysteine S-methyltransferase
VSRTRGGPPPALFTAEVGSPVGTLLLVSDGTALTALLFRDGAAAARLAGAGVPDERAAPFSQARRELAAYFAGRRRTFGIPLAARGTPFQLRVWEALRRIPHGATATYAQVARAVGSPRAVRAVGAANRANHLAIVVPCHRVVGSDGTLTGYAGGLARKEALLEIEAGCRPPPPAAQSPRLMFKRRRVSTSG